MSSDRSGWYVIRANRHNVFRKFYSSPHPRDSSTLTLTVDDFSKLLQSIREQDTLRTDLGRLDRAYIENVMSEYIKGMLSSIG